MKMAVIQNNHHIYRLKIKNYIQQSDALCIKIHGASEYSHYLLSMLTEYRLKLVQKAGKNPIMAIT